MKVPSKLLLILSFFLLQAAPLKANWFTDVIEWITSPVRPVWGKYSEGGSTNRYPPLTTFDRGPDVYWKQREDIRYNIIHSVASYDTIYKKIYEQANNVSVSSKCSDDNVICANAKTAKDAAFVYLMGFDDNGDDLSAPARQAFYDKAVEVLIRDDNWWGGFGWIDFGTKQQYRAKELIELLQAHDYLMTAKGAGITSYSHKEAVRDALADFTYNLYSNANNIAGSLDRYNNLTLMVAGAVGMAACVLSDKETYLWRVQKKPERWANAAHSYIQRTLWDGPGILGSTLYGSKGPMSKDMGDCANCIAGYAEGPGYFHYGFESLLPFFTSFQNFVNRDMSGTYYTSMLNFFGNNVRNYVYNPAFEQNLYKWYNNIKMPNGDCPTYDDTWANKNMSGLLALTRKPQYNTAPSSRLQLEGFTFMQFREDYLAAFTYPTTPTYKDAICYDMSGDLIVRNNTGSLPTEQFIHVNAEGKGSSLNGYRPLGMGHEHGDVGHFIIAAGEDVLAIDPAYYGFKYKDNVHAGNHHNVITIDGDGPDPEDGVQSQSSTFLYPNGNGYKMELKYKYWNYVLGVATSPKAEIKRTVEVYDEGNIRYYQINDEVKNKNWFDPQVVQFNLNGNGNQSDSTYFQYPGRNNSAVWNHPCHKDNNSSDNWKMQASISTFINGAIDTTTIITQNGSSHGNIWEDEGSRYNKNIPSNNYVSGYGAEISKRETSASGDQIGRHSRMSKQIILPHDETVHFKTTIQVLGCQDNTTQPPLMVRNNRYTSHLMALATGYEPLYNFHMSRVDHSNDLDTVINPLHLDSTAILKSDAQSLLFSYSTNNVFPTGRCLSYTHFRKARITDGDTLIYHDTTFIASDKKVEIYYALQGKFNYSGYVRADSGATVNLFLPDLQNGYPMTVNPRIGTASNITYDDSTHVITFQVDAGYTEFTIDISDPCLISCYFPSTTETIDSTFNFDDGTRQTLAHKLDIVQNKGNLTISNGSQMEINCNKYLRNRDSLILRGPCDDDFNIQACGEVGFSYVGTSSSMLVVNSGSALVLDSASYTYIGNGTAIVVKSGGTLVVKDHAFVQVGDDKACGKGQLIAEAGANVYVQSQAHLEFGKTIGDTTDKHLILFKLIPSAVSAGVGSLVDSLLKADTVIPASIIPIPICSLNTVMAPAVHNNDWGYANFMPPVPKISVRNDTLCPGEPLYINLKRILNDNAFKFEVCRVDSYWVAKPTDGSQPHWRDTCIIDSMTIDSMPPDPICRPPHATPDEFVYFFKTHSLHRITFTLNSDCGGSVDTTIYIYVDDAPTFSMNLTQHTACPGKGNVVATTSHNFTGNYSWDVSIIDTSGGIPFIYNSNQSLNMSYHVDTIGTIPDTFSFPGFNFLGGRRYLVSLTVLNDCGSYTQYDTVNIPAGAYIKLQRPMVYAQPVSGVASVLLHGYVSMADSFRWEPTTWLDNPTSLTPTSTPYDSITYTLISHSGSCVAYDTAHIKYNRYANAGYNDTICFDTNTLSTQTLVGFPYDMSLLLGILYYYGGSQFMMHYNNYNTGNIPNYFRYFTHYMHYSTFGDAATTCPLNLYNMFTTIIQKEEFFRQSWYKDYYINFTSFSDPGLPALEQFRIAVENDTHLKDHLDSISNWGNFDPCMDNILNSYNDYVASHVNEITASWIKIKGNDTTALNDAQNDNSFIVIDAPDQTSKYVLTVIAPDVAEIDEILIYLDTLIAPVFAPAMQFDSTVYFSNYTIPNSDATAFLWDFGDGSATVSDANPTHTFPAFDSSYWVCLTASNSCGSWSYCDTVKIDSANVGSFMSVRKNPDNSVRTDMKPDRIIGYVKQQIELTATNPVQLYNYPNPFSNKTIIEYQIWSVHSKAELRVTNILGQEVFSQQLVKPMDKIIIDGSSLQDGLYYYSIVIDGSVNQTRIMSVMH